MILMVLIFHSFANLEPTLKTCISQFNLKQKNELPVVFIVHICRHYSGFKAHDLSRDYQ